MKCLWKKVICGALVAGMLAQCPQSIYAEDAANTATVTDTESNHVTPDTTQQPDDTKQPDDTQQPGDIHETASPLTLKSSQCVSVRTTAIKFAVICPIMDA